MWASNGKEEELHLPYGVTVKEDRGDTRMEIQCAHLSGLLYLVPIETNWVYQPEHLHAHALAGFFESSRTWRTPGSRS